MEYNILKIIKEGLNVLKLSKNFEERKKIYFVSQTKM